MSNFKVGDQIAWTMTDGNAMTGHILYKGFHGRLDVRRVDGGSVVLSASQVRPATPEDVAASIAFYQNLGKAAGNE